MYFTGFTAAVLAAAASAGKIPLRYNPMNINDIDVQIQQMVYNAQRKYGGVEDPEHIALTDNFNTQYFVDITLGSNDQTFTVIPDTGSSNLWVYSKHCRSLACLRHDKYDPDASETYQEDGDEFNISYGSGSVSGYVSQDVAKFSPDITATMKFGEIQRVHGAAFLTSAMDGILGLGFSTISVNHLPTFMDSTEDLEDKSFAFYLHNNPDESYITMPGIDESLGLAEIAVHPVIEKTYWNVNFTSASGPNGTVDTTGYKAAIDSGTSLIMGPKTLLDPLTEGITVN